MKSISLMIVDDHSVVREGLKYLIELKGDFQVTGEAESLSQALEKLEFSQPDIIILDYKLARGDGVIACREIKRRYPKTRVLLLTAFAEPYVVLEALKAGADGYLLKDIDHESLVRALYDIYEGKAVLDPSVTHLVLDRIRIGSEKDDTNLNEQEANMLALISQGLTNQEIADALGVKDKTVRNTISSVFQKIEVSNRTEAASYWLKKEYQGSLKEEE